jgi:hypothetical protein
MGFNERAVVMKLLGTNQVSGARSRPSMKKEKGRAEKKQYREPIQLSLICVVGFLRTRWAPIPKV